MTTQSTADAVTILRLRDEVANAAEIWSIKEFQHAKNLGAGGPGIADAVSAAEVKFRTKLDHFAALAASTAAIQAAGEPSLALSQTQGQVAYQQPLSELKKLQIFAGCAADDLERLHAVLGLPDDQPIDVDDMIAVIADLQAATPAPQIDTPAQATGEPCKPYQIALEHIATGSTSDAVGEAQRALIAAGAWTADQFALAPQIDTPGAAGDLLALQRENTDYRSGLAEAERQLGGEVKRLQQKVRDLEAAAAPSPVQAQPVASTLRAQIEENRQLVSKVNEWRDKFNESEEARMELLAAFNREVCGDTFMGEPAIPAPNVDAMVNRFLGWPLPKTFAPDCGIAFDGRKDDEWNKNKTWPVGTNLFTADVAKAMFQHCFATQSTAPISPAGVEASEIEKDAARYRWLREWRRIEDKGIPWPVCLDPREAIPTSIHCAGVALDSAIDAALDAQRTKLNKKG